jgi:membrane protease YdiL (CAAX protease family)
MCTALLGVVAYGVIYWTYGIGINEMQESLQSATSLAPGALKTYQLFLSLGMFLLPPLIYAILLSPNPWANLRIDRLFSLRLFLLIPLILILGFVLESWCLALNRAIPLPESLEYLKMQEQQIDEILKGFLQMNTIPQLLANIFIVGVVAGVAEELFFRGFLQRFLSKWLRNAHWGIWLAAIIFGAVHQQFYNFIPRVLLGALFGYLFYWSGSLWVAIFAHFLHNSVQVVAVYQYPEFINQELSTEQAFDPTMIFTVIICSVLFAGVMQLFYQQATGKQLRWQ